MTDNDEQVTVEIRLDKLEAYAAARLGELADRYVQQLTEAVSTLNQKLDALDDDDKKRALEALEELAAARHFDTGTEVGNQVMEMVCKERRYQRNKWGDAHDDTHPIATFLELIEDRVSCELDRVSNRTDGTSETDEALIEIAALAVAALEQQERKHRSTTVPADMWRQ